MQLNIARIIFPNYKSGIFRHVFGEICHFVTKKQILLFTVFRSENNICAPYARLFSAFLNCLRNSRAVKVTARKSAIGSAV